MPRVCITVPGKNSQPYRFSLDRKIVRLGRAADNDIIIDCPSVSSHHCEMRRIEGGYILQDLDSTNGIKGDGARMEVIDLENDLEVAIGDADLDFELTDEEIESLKKENHKPQGKPKLPPTIISEPDDEEEDLPRRAPRKRPVAAAPVAGRVVAGAPLASAHQQSGAASFFVTLVFLALAAAAFFLGMSARHSSEFDRSLWEDFFGKPAAAEDDKDSE